MRQVLMFHFLCINQIKDKGKAHPQQGTKAQRGIGGIALLFL